VLELAISQWKMSAHGATQIKKIKIKKKLKIKTICHVRPSVWNNLSPTGRILIKSDISAFLKICRENYNLIEI
jgi:hypothetical protein